MCEKNKEEIVSGGGEKSMQFCHVNCFLPGVVIVVSSPEKEKERKSVT